MKIFRLLLAMFLLMGAANDIAAAPVRQRGTVSSKQPVRMQETVSQPTSEQEPMSEQEMESSQQQQKLSRALTALDTFVNRTSPQGRTPEVVNVARAAVAVVLQMQKNGEELTDAQKALVVDATKLVEQKTPTKGTSKKGPQKRSLQRGKAAARTTPIVRPTTPRGQVPSGAKGKGKPSFVIKKRSGARVGGTTGVANNQLRELINSYFDRQLGNFYTAGGISQDLAMSVFNEIKRMQPSGDLTNNDLVGLIRIALNNNTNPFISSKMKNDLYKAFADALYSDSDSITVLPIAGQAAAAGTMGTAYEPLAPSEELLQPLLTSEEYTTVNPATGSLFEGLEVVSQEPTETDKYIIESNKFF